MEKHKLTSGIKKTALTAVVLSLLCIFAAPLPAYADYYLEEADSYIRQMVEVPMPDTYTLVKIVDSFDIENGYLKEADDLFIDNDGYLYIADTGNNRIIKADKEGNALKVFYGPEDEPFNSPEGIYVNEYGDLFIADTKNERIVHLGPEGIFIEEFTKPGSNMLVGEYKGFEPSKIYINNAGYILMIKRHELMSIDASGNFRGYMSTGDVTITLADLISQLFYTKEQRERFANPVPPAISNFMLDDEGMMYVTMTNSTSSQIRKLSWVGQNIYPKGYYGEKFYNGVETFEPQFTDIAIDSYGIITAVEKFTKNIYRYSQEGEMLSVYEGYGSLKGKFLNPTSIVIDKDDILYVLDGEKNNIQIFEPTYFNNMISEAVSMYHDGEYGKAHELWEEVLILDGNYKYAYIGKGKALYKEKEYIDAMENYIYANDREGYSEAFKEYRHNIYRDNFGWVLLVFAIIFAGIIYVLFKLNNYSKDSKKTGLIHECASMVFHPVDTFMRLKYDNEGRYGSAALKGYLAPVMVLVAALVVKIIYLFTVHYPIASMRIEQTNFFLEMFMTAFPFILWVVSAFAATSILGGECRIKKILISSSYCLVPYIIFSIPLALLSRIMCSEELGIYNALRFGILIWVLVLFFVSIMVMHGYRFKKSVLVTLLILFGMVFMCAVLLLLYVLTGQIFDFIDGILLEARLLAVKK